VEQIGGHEGRGGEAEGVESSQHRLRRAIT
jgi:hypothetical protein